MLGRIYTFERASDFVKTKVSASAMEAMEHAVQARASIRFQELTAPGNPKPVFAVIFPDMLHKRLFEDRMAVSLRLHGLRIAIVQAIEEPRLEPQFA